ncbi:MAG: hypothetical protein GY913_08620 [Proteobacteria bacterium]|nr:hypothetical protein [Pseudomonadota bacterium]MCP4916974.1 hypothetical protein [Pseudomonadota bacterium]
MLLFVLSCAPADQAYFVGAAEVITDDAVVFAATGLDGLTTSSITLTNTGHTAVTVDVEVKGRGFAADVPELLLDPDGAADLALWFTPYGREDAAGELLLTSDVGTRVVTLTGSTLADADEDGHEHLDLGGDDCDDTDATIYTGADEVWYDDIDQDCLGGDDWDADLDGFAAEPEGLDCDDTRADAHPGGTEVWYDGVDQDCEGDSDFDQDHDGYEVFEDTSYPDHDCDDLAENVNPGVPELWYNGTDDDCSGGSDYDQDGDGVEWPDDCNDTDPSVGTC